MEKSENPVFIYGEKISLRDRLPTDVETFLSWQTRGEWRGYDAPWEGNPDITSPTKKEAYKKCYLEKIIDKQQTQPRKRAVIITQEGKPLGWVNRYEKPRSPQIWYIGIDICEDSYLNKGIGTEALSLWIQYLFTNSNIHKISLDTWSFNPRMMRVARKLGFVYEGAERELIEWQGEWLDLVHFGLLRREWKEKFNENQTFP